ncbi:MAG: hypothetical protein KAR06_03070 [Deltaproteobacteria bacterium]|nr:hypothetical protein [Deltaproteobacteria bacterium]
MANFEVQVCASYYRYIEVEAQDAATARGVARDIVQSEGRLESEVGNGFLDYGNEPNYEASPK